MTNSILSKAMKHTTNALLAGLLVVGLASCNENAKLASEAEGIRSGNATVLNKKENQKHDKNGEVTSPVVESVTPSFTFTKVESVKNGGKVIFSGVYAISQSVSSTAVDVPFQASANVKATATGNWVATDDDEIKVTFDPATVSTTLDPESITFGYAVLTDKPVSELDSLKAALIPNLDKSFGAEVQKRVASIKELDDIKISGTTMNLEINKTDFTLTKQ